MFWQKAVYFPMVDHLVQELNDRILSQENRFSGQCLVPAKLNAFKSGVQDKLYETCKSDLSEKRDFGNKILRWQTKWSHSTEEKPAQSQRHSSTLLKFTSNLIYKKTDPVLFPSTSSARCSFHK